MLVLESPLSLALLSDIIGFHLYGAIARAMPWRTPGGSGAVERLNWLRPGLALAEDPPAAAIRLPLTVAVIKVDVTTLVGSAAPFHRNVASGSKDNLQS